jgi:rubrerythrin
VLHRREAIARLARGAGLAGPVLAFLEGRADAITGADATDVRILSAALTLEHEAIALYAFALDRNLVPSGLREYAIEFKGSHEGHRDTQIEILRERGVEPAEAPRRAEPFRSTTSPDAALRRLLSVEAAAESAYLALISQIRTNDYLLTAGFIVVDEARHQTVWRRALGLSIY